MYTISIIPGILYKSDEESGMGSGTIYACARFNKNEPKEQKNKPRFDYVYVDYGEVLPVLARVLCILHITHLNHDEHDSNDSKILLLIQHLIRKFNHGSILGEIYEFASDPEDRNQFRFDIVTVQSILRPAFVVPVFRKSYNPLSHSIDDRFWVLDRKFFDRSGWETSPDVREYLNTANKQSEYINNHQTANRIRRQSDLRTNEESDSAEEEYDSDICIS